MSKAIHNCESLQAYNDCDITKFAFGHNRQGGLERVETRGRETTAADVIRIEKM